MILSRSFGDRPLSDAKGGYGRHASGRELESGREGAIGREGWRERKERREGKREREM